MIQFLHPAAIIGALPNTLTNGTTADAVQVMADFNWIVNQVNANAASATGVALLAAANTFTQVQSGINASASANFPVASQIQNNVFQTLTSTLGTNTLTARCAALPLSAYQSGQVFTFVPSQTNTGPSNITVDAAGSSIIFSNAATLIGGEMVANVPAAIYRDGTKMNLLNPTAGATAGSSLALIRSQAAANSASIDFTSGITTQFDEYLVTFTDVVAATNGTNLSFRISQAGSFKSDANYSFGATTGATASRIAANISSTAADSLSGEFRIFGPSNSTTNKKCTSVVSFCANGGTPAVTTTTLGQGYFANTTAIDGLRFLMDAGNITSGTFTLYGVKKA